MRINNGNGHMHCSSLRGEQDFVGTVISYFVRLNATPFEIAVCFPYWPAVNNIPPQGHGVRRCDRLGPLRHLLRMLCHELFNSTLELFQDPARCRRQSVIILAADFGMSKKTLIDIVPV